MDDTTVDFPPKNQRWLKPWTWSRARTGSVLTFTCLLLTVVLVIKGYQKSTAYGAKVVVEKTENIGFAFSIANPPTWMPRATVAEIRAQIERYSSHDEATYRRFQNPLDNDILKTVADFYTSKNFAGAGVDRQSVGPNAWIKNIVQVRRVIRSDRNLQWIEIYAEFRKPAAVVAVPVGADGRRLTSLSQIVDPVKVPAMKYFLVDGNQVRLPDDKNLSRANLTTLYGIDEDVPAPGGSWKAPELTEGLKLAATLHGQPFASQIALINLTNYSGRASSIAPNDAGSAQISMLTYYGTHVYWGRPIGSEGLNEVRPARKIATLADVFQQYKRIDAGRQWIDIRYDDPKVNIITPPPPPGRGATTRRAARI
jgi:hypothetical protein